MSTIRSATTAALASAVLATMLTGCQLGGAQQEKSPLVIGADLELSGAAASVGRAYQRALELKVEQVNSAGGVDGRKIELRVKDNRSDPSESQRNIGDLTGDSSVSAIIMGSCNACAVASAKTVNDRHVPTIALASTDEVVEPITERRYLFKLAPNAADNAAALTAELKRRGVRKVALLRSDDDYGREGLENLTGELNKAAIRITAAEAVKPTDTDVSEPVQKLMTKKANALVVWTPPEQAMLAATSARQAGFNGSVFFDALAAGDLFMGGATRSMDDTTMVFTQTMVIDDVIATTPAKAARKQWFRDYTARYGDYYGFSSFAADAVQLIVDAASRSADTAGSPKREVLRDVLETSQMDGLSGPIRITPDNHSGLMPQALTMLVARGGRWRLAG